jgi:hypothetical protein
VLSQLIDDWQGLNAEKKRDFQELLKHVENAALNVRVVRDLSLELSVLLNSPLGAQTLAAALRKLRDDVKEQAIREADPDVKTLLEGLFTTLEITTDGRLVRIVSRLDDRQFSILRDVIKDPPGGMGTPGMPTPGKIPGEGSAGGRKSASGTDDKDEPGKDEPKKDPGGRKEDD